jgi:hypothetical protein
MNKESTNFLRDVYGCIEEAEKNGLYSTKGQDVLGGLSGSKTVGVLQRLSALFCEDADACYLEIGVFQGLTLLSVASAHPALPCFGIDNFSILDPDGKNLGIVEERTKKIGAENAVLINQDFEAALERLGDWLGGRKIGVYFVDGAHDYRSQLMALMLAFPYLHEKAVILVDDANYAFVRQSTRDFLLTHPDYKMIFEAYSPSHPANMDAETLEKWEGDWLNGINILVRDHENALPVMLPPTMDDRSLYVNEWLVHRHSLAELAPKALDLAQAVCQGGDESSARKAVTDHYQSLKPALSDRYADRNTYSSELTRGRFNKRP